MTKSEKVGGDIYCAEVTRSSLPDDVLDDTYFVMQDGQHSFIVPLETILLCLRFAEREGEVPALPLEWWQLLQIRYRQLN
ncbi:hypothetical protein NGC36_21240 [Serratia rubidaea]|uniref:hypothetical protein n=1 Tax=Serratia rubidaea TaxID=61652 RepID=UPI002DB81D6D|nr:hypothetical protein [Serratia rubidaea]MEB7587795.1 hypothetical protein [Serratia rubidaea]